MRCVACKGRGFCGRPFCPILRRFEAVSSLPPLGQCLEGYTPPEVFVGRKGYPLVGAGPMIPVDDNLPDRSNLLTLDVGQIIALRSRIVRGEAKVRVDEAKQPGKLLDVASQMAMSNLPVGAMVSFWKPPRGTLSFDGVLSPTGPSAPLRDVEITTNPSVPRKVDQLVEDRSVKAFDAVTELYASSVDLDQISRLLSLGLLGQARKLVPTRWSITASDDMVGRSLREKVLDLPHASGYELYSAELLGNHFEIILSPGTYSFELLEIWLPRSVWSSEETWIGADREDSRGKSEYSSLSGGYYAARLAVLEALARMGRQAEVLALREITEDYWAPLGVWVVREAARRAMSAERQGFDTQQAALASAQTRMRTPSSRWMPYSSLGMPKQATLSSFF